MAVSLDQFASEKLEDLETRAQRRVLSVTDRLSAVRVRRDGRELISFCCNDYLNLATDPRVKAAAQAAIDAFGTGAGASRLVTGNHSLLGDLESALAKLKGTEDAVVFGSGYLANVGIIPTFAGEGDLILADEFSHACLNAGAQLSGAAVIRFRHNDMDDLAALLARERAAHQHCLIVTDGVFSMDGDLAPLAELAALAKDHDAWLMTDDAHGVGVLGRGRGSAHMDGGPPVPLQMGTLSKALGSYGGYLCASKPVCDLIRTRARSLVYSTGLPPASAAAALEALRIIQETEGFWELPVRRAARFCEGLGLPAPQSPIVPLIIGEERHALELSLALEEAGFLVTAIRPPTVPAGTARLRFTFTAGHTEAEVDALVKTVRDLMIPAAAE